jgi:hypothetical protein
MRSRNLVRKRQSTTKTPVVRLKLRRWEWSRSGSGFSADDPGRGKQHMLFNLQMRNQMLQAQMGNGGAFSVLLAVRELERGFGIEQNMDTGEKALFILVMAFDDAHEDILVVLIVFLLTTTTTPGAMA